MYTSARTETIPTFPTLPKDEYENRFFRIRESMDKLGIDILLLTEQENVEYLSGYLSSHWFMHGVVPGVVIIPLSEDPILVVPRFWLGTAQKKSWFENIYTHSNTHSDPDSFADVVIEIIKNHNWSKCTIGYEAGQELTLGMPIQQFDKIRNELSEAKWTPGGHTIWAARKIKSTIELLLLSKVASDTCKALERTRISAHEGMSESEIGQITRKYQVEEGCEDRHFLNIRCGPPRYSMTDTLPENRPIQKGEMMILDVGMYQNCYWSDTARCASIGKPSSLYQDVYSVILAAQQAALGTIHDGASASAPYFEARRILDSAGYGVHIDMMGHGIGMSMYEPPMLSPLTSDILRTGMVLCVEPWITLSEDRGVLCLEETITVTRDGYEKLTNWESLDLWIIE